MTIAFTLQRYLAAKNIRYDVMAHQPTSCSMETAKACHLSGDCVAKGVLLRDDAGYFLAILPASHHIRLSELRSQFGDDVDLATEYEATELFTDCSRGSPSQHLANATGSTCLSTTASRSNRKSISKLEITEP
jgi:Ala-tRNA(Pro) deacylase